MSVLPCRCLLAVLLVVAATCPRTGAQTPPARRLVAVFAADGAGNFRVASMMLRQIVEEDQLPLEVYAFEWSHGYARILSDQMAFSHACDKGKQLAEQVLAYHARYPTIPIYLYSHSAGCAVAAKALEALPPGVVERAILLAPALSANYDVVPLLERVNRGLHVFYSRQDWCYLGVCTYMVGTADRHFGCCSGRVGFRPDPAHLDPALAAKLFQHPWQPEDRALGNNGGHYGGYQPPYLRAYVIPLLVESDVNQSPSPRS
jgi:hypothetical protein